MTLSPGE